MHDIALVLVDPERCFYPASEGERLNEEGFGALGVEGAEKINDNLNELTKMAEMKGMRIVHTLDKHPVETAHFSDEPNYVNTWPVHGVDGTPGSLLHPELLIAQRPEMSVEFIKGDVPATSPEDDTSYTGALAHPRKETITLPEYLRQVGVIDVIIGGLAIGDGLKNPLCVDSTAIDLKKLGFDVTVITDATEAVLPENREKCFKNLGAAGIKLMTVTEAVLSVETAYA